jgi:protein involved in polysaccharide export with SLBB domain
MRLRVIAIGVVIVAAFWTAPSGSLAPVLGSRIVAQAGQPAIFVAGNVNRPGKYPYTDGMTVQTALDAAGGIATKGDAQETLILVRLVGGKPVKIDATRQTAMNSADTLYVPVERLPKP